MDKTKIELTDDDAIFFQFCMENRYNIEKLKEYGFFDIAASSATIFFNPEGQIKMGMIPHK